MITRDGMLLVWIIALGHYCQSGPLKVPRVPFKGVWELSYLLVSPFLLCKVLLSQVALETTPALQYKRGGCFPGANLQIPGLAFT